MAASDVCEWDGMSQNTVSGWGLQKGIGGDDDVRRLYFFKKLQAVTNKIHATGKISDIMLDLSADICDLFGCERLTIYVVNDSRTTIDTLVKIGLRSFKDFSLPISNQSVAGFVALAKKTVNITDVYDDNELKSYDPPFQFQQDVDQRTGFRTRELLVSPIVDDQTRELLGVLQIINNRAGAAFSMMMEEGAVELCKTLAIAFSKRLQNRLGEQVFADSTLSAQTDLMRDYHTAAINQLVWRVKHTIANAFTQGAGDIQIELETGKDEPVSELRPDGSLKSVNGQVVVNFHFNFPEPGGVAAEAKTAHVAQDMPPA